VINQRFGYTRIVFQHNDMYEQGMTARDPMMPPLTRECCLLWNFTCSDTMAPLHIYKSSLAAGSAASNALARKSEKYSGLTVAHTFVSISVEPFGA